MNEGRRQSIQSYQYPVKSAIAIAAVVFIQKTDISINSPGKVSSTGFALGGHMLP